MFFFSLPLIVGSVLWIVRGALHVVVKSIVVRVPVHTEQDHCQLPSTEAYTQRNNTCSNDLHHQLNYYIQQKT